MKIKKIKFILIVVGVLIVAGFVFWKVGSRSFEIGQSGSSQASDNISPITGLVCENYNMRPFAVMLATDPETRPLSGIGQADLVVEMPVTNTITRLMAVFNCIEPDEIGSARSARHDYIPIAKGLDAIYAHWGGSHFALDELDNGIIDNIDALKDYYSAYYRKEGVEAPHNGFTSYGRLFNFAEKADYRLENNFEGYPHLKESEIGNQNLGNEKNLTIGYAGSYKIYYEYNSENNTYLRWRGGQKEIDKNTNKQAEASVIVVMKADMRMIEPPDYNDVDVEGVGEVIIYQNNAEIKGYWKKTGTYSDSKLYFYNENDKEIKLVPGKIWIEIVEPSQEIKWE